MTFFRNLPGIDWIGPDPAALADALAARIRDALRGSRGPGVGAIVQAGSSGL